MKVIKKLTIFFLGGAAYIGLELLWRGRSHISMFLAGGLCLLLIGHQGELSPKPSLPARVLAGAGIITMVELGTGLLVNRQWQVWDYRDQWGNFLGQICPLFCLIWIPVAMAAVGLYEMAEKKLKKILG